MVEVLECPGLVCHRLHGVGIAETFVRALGAVDDVPEIGADLVGAALFEGVAGRALLGDFLALRDIAFGEQRGKRGFFFGGSRVAAAMVIAAIGDLNIKARCFRQMHLEQLGRERVHAQYQQQSAEHRAGNLVQFIAVHGRVPAVVSNCVAPSGR